MLTTILTISLVILGIIMLIGIIRLIFTPADNMLDFFVHLMLLDWMGDILGWIIDTTCNLKNDD